MSTPLYPLRPIGAYHSYLVRLWQERPQTAWRALAQHVQTGETLRFADLDSLFAFLQAQTRVSSTGAADPPIALE